MISENKIEFNKSQLAAINAPEDKVLILAPAGSGKSTVLASSIVKYKEENPDASVVAITFTNKATEDLYKKIGRFTHTKISTIHSWAYQELIALSEKVSKLDPLHSFKIKLLQDDKIKEIFEDLIKKRRYNYIKIDILFSFVMGNYMMDISDKLKVMFMTIAKDYQKYKETNGLYDFTDLPQYLLDKLNDFNEDIDHIDGLFVDEFQDVDPIQLELFNRVKAEKKFFIGDVRQSIYQFRGATQDVLKKLEGFTTYELDTNYRSNQEIIDFATTFYTNAGYGPTVFPAQLESFKSNIFCEKGSGGNVYVMPRTGSAYKVNEFIKEPGEKVIREFLALNPMILCRKNKQVREIKELGWDRVQTVHQAKGLEYDSVIVTDFEIDLDEERNIAYVALTRAKENLLSVDYGTFLKILTRIYEKDGTLNQHKFDSLF